MQSVTNSIMAARNAILEHNRSLREIADFAQQTAKIEQPQKTEASHNLVNNADQFIDQFNNALHHVNDMQHKSAEAAKAYELGETTDIAAVMMAKQKASIGFEATLQVRNKLLNAYNDIMKMPV